MKVAIGIDLGSTTTKAVILDDAGAVLGRGITNSRANYDVACAVARNEALIDARFNLLQRRAPFELFSDGSDVDPAKRERFRMRLELGFRLEQFLGQLLELEHACRAHHDDARYDACRSRMSVVLDQIFAAIRYEAPKLFAEGSARASNFFRDLAGARFLELAERFSRVSLLPFEELMGLYDKSIIQIENRIPDASFESDVLAALRRAFRHDDAERTGLHDAFQSVIVDVVHEPLAEACVVGTGYGRARLPFPREHIRSEILCHGLGAHAMFPRTRTVLDIGGQDTKAIQVDGEGMVTSFQMNDRCAAGCGRYLGYIADEMNIGVQELGPLAEKSKSPTRITSTCTVFAGAELRDKLALGLKREDILAGLHRAIILRAMSLLARSGGVEDELTFTGGVARNQAAVAALRDLVQESYGPRIINISPDSIYTGALGAALFAHRAANHATEGTVLHV